jgi:uncharacterized zinc-type alcohol dehydrogenase-like protein
MCAGISVWEPLRRWVAGPGTAVGVVGLGGLGHLAVKFAHALGADVTVITTSPRKADDARALGADHVVDSTDEKAMADQADRLDLILDCAPVATTSRPTCAASPSTARSARSGTSGRSRWRRSTCWSAAGA